MEASKLQIHISSHMVILFLHTYVVIGGGGVKVPLGFLGIYIRQKRNFNFIRRVQKFKMVACKPEVLISQLVDEIETRFQGLTPPIFGVQESDGLTWHDIAN